MRVPTDPLHQALGHTASDKRLEVLRRVGQTGSISQAARDAWFVGFTADYVAGVWMGYDDNTPLTGVTGGGLPAKLWHAIMMEAHQGLPPRDLPGLNGSPSAANDAPPAPDSHASRFQLALKRLPPMNLKELATKLGVESVEKLKEIVRGQIESQYGNVTRQKVKRQILDQLDALYKFESPSKLVDAEFENIWRQINTDLAQSGKTFADEDTTEEEARDEDAQLIEPRRHRLCQFGVMQHDRNDRVLAGQQIEAEGGEARAPIGGVLGELRAQVIAVAHEAQCRDPRCGDRGRAAVRSQSLRAGCVRLAVLYRNADGRRLAGRARDRRGRGSCCRGVPVRDRRAAGKRGRRPRARRHQGAGLPGA